MRSILTCGMLGLCLCGMAGCGPPSSESGNETVASPSSPSHADGYLARRERFATSLLVHGPAPQRWSDELPENVNRIEYSSHGRSLAAWLYRPASPPGTRHQALVYLHGGFALGKGDFADCEPFVAANYVVFLPSYRGENGNPGDFELFFGEADDAAETVRWLASQDYVDPEQIFVFGHSAGGVISGLLSLFEDCPAKHTGSAGGLYGHDLFEGWEAVPFNVSNKREMEMRLLVGNTRWMKRPHYAYVGDEDYSMKGDVAEQEAESNRAPLVVVRLAGDHHSMLGPAMGRYLEVCQQSQQ